MTEHKRLRAVLHVALSSVATAPCHFSGQDSLLARVQCHGAISEFDGVIAQGAGDGREMARCLLILRFGHVVKVDILVGGLSDHSGGAEVPQRASARS